MVMTKNPLAIAGGVAIMLFGISLGCFFGYNLFLEEKMYRKANKTVMGTLVRKEEQKIFNDALSAKATKGTTTTAQIPAESTAPAVATTDTKSASKTAATTIPAEKPLIRYNLHYAFTPADATEPVTSVLSNTTKRLFDVMKENDEIEIIYNKDNPKEDHRALFPYKFGNSFYGGVAALLGGALFITYLGWCFIFPED